MRMAQQFSPVFISVVYALLCTLPVYAARNARRHSAASEAGGPGEICAVSQYKTRSAFGIKLFVQQKSTCRGFRMKCYLPGTGNLADSGDTGICGRQTSKFCNRKLPNGGCSDSTVCVENDAARGTWTCKEQWPQSRTAAPRVETTSNTPVAATNTDLHAEPAVELVQPTVEDVVEDARDMAEVSEGETQQSGQAEERQLSEAEAFIQDIFRKKKEQRSRGQTLWEKQAAEAAKQQEQRQQQLPAARSRSRGARDLSPHQVIALMRAKQQQQLEQAAATALP